ncbi:hypothetical protein RRF57_004276 [Xylaria bambusicola]|uniref:Uncharacterized protein n=1 Tax=Xylaria bambusicola TaxID=326684 RepID=A0AAN7ULM7_9PEZI
MPVILDNGSDKIRKWLDPKRYEWSKELQSLLVPYDGELEVYPVSKDVGKVGNNSPSFIIPIDSKENKSNIANFFAKGAATKKDEKSLKEERGQADDIPHTGVKPEQPEIEITETKRFKAEDEAQVKSEDVEGYEDTEKVPVGIKREATEETMGEEPPKKLATTALSKSQVAKNTEPSPRKGGNKQKISATSNNSRSPTKASKSAGTQKITKFFANSS